MWQHPTSTNKSQYRTISNLVRTMTRYETKKRATDLSQSSSTVKKFWSWVNSVRRHSTSLPPLWLDNSTVTSVHTKADMFNKYFYSVSTHEDTSNLEALRNSVSFLSPIIQSVTVFIMN